MNPIMHNHLNFFLRTFRLIILFIFLFCSCHHENNIPCENPIIVTTITLIDDHESNIVVAKEKYFNKSIQITGKIYEINFKSKDQIEIDIFESNDPLDSTDDANFTFLLNTTQNNEIKKYKTGNFITLCGTYISFRDFLLTKYFNFNNSIII